jgi:ribosomal protein S18 acetylase RimI-like enzyme
MKLSLYAQYLQERTNRGILEIEDGFATFDYIDNYVYIIDLYVKPEKRNSHVASELADKICEQALKDGKEFLLGSVDANAKGADISHKVLKAYGMVEYKVVEPMIFYVKPLKNVESQDKEEING